MDRPHRLTRNREDLADEQITTMWTKLEATTVETWWDGIEAFLRPGITNAKSKGINRAARNAYDFRNPENQCLRTRSVTNKVTASVQVRRPEMNTSTLFEPESGSRGQFLTRLNSINTTSAAVLRSTWTAR